MGMVEYTTLRILTLFSANKMGPSVPERIPRAEYESWCERHPINIISSTEL